ncbi:hypothetical protein GQ53DRAFT_821400 [Thozetella sp. PMI_491]|nr:hypothetical protein GQ53DRAFT_821400 [Thozetella sp. PMI_491]
MESWRPNHTDIYTSNSTIWVQLMNASTVDLSIGFFPSSVVAIPGLLNSSYNFSDGSIVIEKASRQYFGTVDIEEALFGATSGIVILWAIIWLAIEIRRGHFSCPKDTPTPEGEENRPSGLSNQSGVSGSTERDPLAPNFLNESVFKDKLLHYYYAPTNTELEPYERTIGKDGVSRDDIVKISERLRKMYLIYLDLWAHGNSPDTSEEEKRKWRNESQAIWTEFRRLMSSWDQATGRSLWNEDEMAQVREITSLLGQLPNKLY